MKSATIYHNPRCSKSRQTLALLEEHGVKTKVVEYIKTPPSEETIRQILQYLNVSALEIIRTREHGELNLPETDDEDELIRRMATHPRIIQRPIVVIDNEARVGRPPDNVLEIL